MLSTAQATQVIAAAIPQFESEQVSLVAAAGRILRQDIQAERDQPPFDRVMMDGIAIQFASFAGGQRDFTVQGIQQAGDPVMTLEGGAHCIEIMTGAVMPEGADCVVPVERIQIEDGVAVVAADYQVEAGQFIHPQGSDHVQGSEVLQTGSRISPMDIAIIASCGLQEVAVSRLPVVRVVSTGNELVAAGQPIEPQQIRMSNGPALLAMLGAQGFANCNHDHLPDDLEVLQQKLRQHLRECDVLILSGGVSMGKADFVPQVLANLGVTLKFHKISQRPGKPMWFGIGPDEQVVFALPGNPVSALVCCRQYVLPAILQASGRRQRPSETAVLAEEVTFRPRLTCFLPVRVAGDINGRIVATPAPTNTSGDFTALSGTQGYVELALESEVFSKGAAVPLHRWDNP